MNRVFILGAGFGGAISNNMPTMTELSAAVQENLKASGRPEIPGASTPLANNFEQWLSYLIESPPWLSEGDQLRNRGAFIDVSNAVHDVLAERQDAVLAHNPCPVWLGQLVRYWQRNEATVITFNYDLLVELAWLKHISYESKSRLHLYPVPLTHLSARTGLTFGPTPAPRGMRLLKLHGSLNWRYSGAGSPPGDIIYDAGTFPWNAWGVAADSTGDTGDTGYSDRDPMIIPPAAVKSPYYNNRTLRALWKLAAEELQKASELVLMGFSLPQTDLLVGSMLATNFAIKDESIIVPVDYSGGIISRVQDTFGLGEDDEHLIGSHAGKGDDAIPAWVRAFAGESTD
jgi:hypothetical protein